LEVKKIIPIFAAETFHTKEYGDKTIESRTTERVESDGLHRYRAGTAVRSL